MIHLFKKRVEWRPPPGLFEPTARSAFRVLGLGATATQAEVFDAASGLRLALKLGVRKRFETDAEWLGEVGRAESDVRDAVGRLSEPAQRARERLFWFSARAPQANVSTVAELKASVEALLARVPRSAFDSEGSGDSSGGVLNEEEAAALHDAALLALAGLVRLDPALRCADEWARAFALWRRLFGCEEFWSLLVAADLKGDYEQLVTFGEVSELRRQSPRVVSAHAAGRARDATLAGDFHGAAHALSLLRGAGLPAPLLRELEEEVVGPAEDKLTEDLDQAFSWLGLGFENKSTPARRNYCNMTWRRFMLVRPRLAGFARLAGADSFYARRVFEHASSKLFRLADAFEEAGRPPEALFVLLKAHALAPHGSEELTSMEEKLRALGAWDALRERDPADYGAEVERELADARVPPKLFKDDPRGGKTLDSFTRKSNAPGWLTSFGFWLLMVLVGVGARACVGGKSRSSYPSFNSLPTLNVRPNLNFNVNLNYNIPPPLNLRPYSDATRNARRPRGKRQRPPRNDNATPAQE